jgi:pSer/pThr/pTyr-binding forkhead associated (FHA) protein
MGDASSWLKLLKICRTMKEATFVASYPAHLIVKPLRTDRDSDSAKAQPARGFETALADPSSYTDEDIVAWDKTLALLPIVKRAGAIFQDRISVGRTRNSDIVIDHPKVSKFHAYFSISNGSYILSDADSTNGTFVAGQRISPNQNVPISDESEIRFGIQSTIFILPHSLYKFLQNWRETQ